MNFKKMAAAFLTGACMLTAIGCGGGGGGEKPKDAKAEQSLKGKEVVLYVSFHEDTTKELAKGFKEKTGCEVKFIRLPTGEAVARLIAEKDAPKADVWLGGTIDAHEKMKAEGITTKYTSPDEKNLPAAYVDKDGFWKGTYLETLGVPPDRIDNCMLIVGAVFRQAAEGNLRAFQEIRSLIENDETDLERRTKRANLEKTKAQIEDIRRKLLDDNDCREDGPGLLTGVLEESMASLWAEGKGDNDS